MLLYQRIYDCEVVVFSVLKAFYQDNPRLGNSDSGRCLQGRRQIVWMRHNKGRFRDLQLVD